MTVTYESSDRVKALSTDTLPANTPNGTIATLTDTHDRLISDGADFNIAGWKEVGRTTLGSAVDTISVKNLPNKRYLMILNSMLATGGSITNGVTFNGDSGSNYAYRKSNNGAADTTSVNQAILDINVAGETTMFNVIHLANLSAKEKLHISHGVGRSTSGAGTAPTRNELVGKWANTSTVINRIDSTNTLAGSYAIGSEIVVLAYDPLDVSTPNFWEELASVTLGSSGDNLSSGTFTAKKYLWVQMYCKPTGGNIRQRMSFNNDSTTYASRRSNNGATDATTTGASIIDLHGAFNDATPKFTNLFIINNSANEKLVIANTISRNTAGAANAPDRVEVVGKWDNTSSQITEIDVDNDDTGSYDTGSTIKVWGHD